MAIRPAWRLENNKIQRKNFEFKYFPGFSVSQKQRSIASLHDAIGGKVLEISTKSSEDIGRKLSAFNLKLNGVPLECVFQAAKRYENGGPYLDLLERTPKEAKTDDRHKTSGKLVSFEYDDNSFPNEPKTIFYDYIYTMAVKESISVEEIEKIRKYEWFTDIEFNPNRSVNCQARTVAVLKAMLLIFGKIPEMKGRFSEFRSLHAFLSVDLS